MILDEEPESGHRQKVSIGVAELDAIFTQRLLHVLEHTEHGAALQLPDTRQQPRLHLVGS